MLCVELPFECELCPYCKKQVGDVHSVDFVKKTGGKHVGAAGFSPEKKQCFVEKKVDHGKSTATFAGASTKECSGLIFA